MNTAQRLALKAALSTERAVHTLAGARRRPQVIEPYTGYATPDELVLLGRVHSALSRAEPRIGQSRFTNFRQMVSMFLTKEVAGAEVSSGGVTVRSDEEGYIRLHLPRTDALGWVDRPLTLVATGGETHCPVLVPEATGDALIISDIDDTVMMTRAYSLALNLWTSTTGNALTRQVFPDAAVLLHRLHAAGKRPVFYVSSSPWNLSYFLNTVFERASLVRGPMFLRDLGISETKFVTQGHGSHKGSSIDTILAANPTRPAILMGDTGQKDAIIYREAIQRHPDRITAVILRTPGPGLSRKDMAHIDALKDTGVPTFTGTTFAGVFEALAL